MSQHDSKPARGRSGTARTNDDASAEIDRAWWKEAVVYQIYPRSFNDSDGDGVGDIPGITEKVSYLDELGVDVVWLCPVYGSPNADNGYDISDYRSIMDEFGTMDDWEELLDALHDRDMRLIMDLVVNHTSNEHEWFQRSRRREGTYEDYYIWRDGDTDEDGDPTPPNNWKSFFGGPAWTYDEERGQWYLHLFDENQPDLNWRNSDVREAVKEMITSWLERGIDGFRMDALHHLSKAEGLPDGDPEESLPGSDYYTYGPNLHEYIREVYDDTLSNYDVMTVAEMGEMSAERAATYLGEDGAGLDMIFEFEHLGVDVGPNGPWDPDERSDWDLSEFKEIIDRKQRGLADEGWNALFLGNHDVPRIVSRFGDDGTGSGDGAYRRKSAKLIATFLLTMRGTPYVYQGEEIGMTNVDFESLDEIDDPATLGIVEELIAEGTVESYDEVRETVNQRSRDHARTPMQWSDAPNAGFTDEDADPWLKCNANYETVNVEAARADEDSILHHYRDLIDLRHDRDVLVYGDYELLLPNDEQLYVYTRTLVDETILVVLNWSDEPATVDTGDLDVAGADVVISNYDDTPANPDGKTFRPYEATVYRLACER
ncbi:glycoside hydrolase family 13 protein [Halogeometricum salsisoli]|uniref:glycoside hydrolase family 13 protein n=1 Tax=Halogeometricum salsisoli TaxID=2950536 RepID=UPI00287BAF79|nr:alpha-glucosidase [Halogeometricum sp. S1BR25-6]